MREPISLMQMGKKLRAVGSRLYVSPSDETFHEFCIQVVASDFPREWYDEEKGKPRGERHVVADWWISYCDFTRTHSSVANRTAGVWSSRPCGDAWSLITLGYDLFCVRDNARLPDRLVARLNNRDNFQGARYELAVAAIFVRSGFAITFTEDKAEKHHEFNAARSDTGEVIAVEAKSRHRPGVLHQPAAELSRRPIRVGVKGLLNRALRQAPPDVPFVVFIDLNLPVKADLAYPDRIWWKDMLRAFEDKSTPSAESRDNLTMLFLTNFSYHYAGQALINTRDYASDVGRVIRKHPRNPFRHPDTMEMIELGVSSYGHVPHNW